MRESQSVAGALAGLSRAQAPAALDALIDFGPSELELFHPGEGQELLDVRVLDVRVLGSLQRLRAPDVLERLVDEELRAPEAAQAKRQVGDLDRLTAPQALQRRLESTLHLGLPRRPLLATLSTLAAAAVVLLLAVLTGPWGSSTPPSRSFDIVEVHSLGGLDPVARTLGDALTGGSLVVSDAGLSSGIFDGGAGR